MLRSRPSLPSWVNSRNNWDALPDTSSSKIATSSSSRSMSLMIPPSSRLSLQPHDRNGLLPLVLTLSVDPRPLLETPPDLLRAVVSCVLRGVVKNSLSAEFGSVLSYWIRTNTDIGVCRNRLMDHLMMQVDETFEAIIPTFVNIARQLSVYSTEDQLITDLLRFDPVDGSLVVRISNE